MADPTIGELLAGAIAQLDGSDSPRLDAELLLGYCLGKPRSYLFAWPERQVEPAARDQFLSLIERRKRGEPVAHLLGAREFWSLPLEVDASTLIPRPDTELLVEQALLRITPTAPCAIVDLGTGTGAIALALARECPHCRITATDRSADAVELARRNAETLGSDIELLAGRWFEPLSGRRFHLIVSNPPYIAESDPHLDEGDVRFEPRSALVSGGDGLDDIRLLIEQAPGYLLSDGWLLLEHGYDQQQAVTGLLQRRGFIDVECYCDLAGNPRISVGRWVAPTPD